MKLIFLPAKLSFKKYSFLKTSRPQVFRLNSQEDCKYKYFPISTASTVVAGSVWKKRRGLLFEFVSMEQNLAETYRELAKHPKPKLLG